MTVVDIPGFDPWFASSWAFGLVAAEAQKRLSDPDDKSALEHAEARQGLFLDMKPPEQAARLAESLAAAARVAASELRLHRRDERDIEAAALIEELERRLVATYGDKPPGG